MGKPMLEPTQAHRRVPGPKGRSSDYGRGRADGLGSVAFERPASVIRDRHAHDLDRRPASLDDFAPCSCKPGLDEAGNHVAIEPVGEHKQVLGNAVRNATEQLKRTALFPSEEVTRSWQPRLQGPHRIWLRKDAASGQG